MPVELHGVYYTLSEAADVLGYNTTSNLAHACQDGRIPSIKVGKQWLIHEEWIKTQEKITPKGQGARGVRRK